jgi:hypothetical protein
MDGADRRLPHKVTEISGFRRVARLMLMISPTGTPFAGRWEMHRFEAIAGSVVWIAVALLMAAVALEPVEVHAQPSAAQTVAAATCADGSAELAMGCESIHL